MIKFLGELVLEAVAPRTCITCLEPLGLNGGVYGYCDKCTLDWFLFELNNVSRVLILERFNSVWTKTGFRMKEGSTLDLIYKCKYSGRPKMLKDLGKWFANHHPLPHDDVVLIPIPLNWKRKFRRGYNLAELLAMGMGEVWDVGLDCWSLKRRCSQKIPYGIRQKREIERC